MPIIAFIVIIILLIIFNIKIVREGYVYVIETLGKYSATWEPGLHIKIPFIQRIGQRVSMKEQVADFEPQRVITKDNVSITSDSVVYFKIFDAYSSVYKVQNYSVAIQNLFVTRIRTR